MPADKTTTHRLSVLKASLATNTFSGPNHLHSCTSSFHESSDTFSFHFLIVWSKTDESRNVCTYVQLRTKRVQEVTIGIVLPIFKMVARTGWAVKVTRRPAYLWEGDPVPILQEDGWASGPGWMFPEKSHISPPPPTRFPAPDPPAPNKLPYRPHYPGQVHRQCRHGQFATYSVINHKKEAYPLDKVVKNHHRVCVCARACVWLAVILVISIMLYYGIVNCPF